MVLAELNAVEKALDLVAARIDHLEERSYCSTYEACWTVARASVCTRSAAPRLTLPAGGAWP
jgi:hypothetical protein